MKTRENISITLPKGGGKILEEMAKKRNISRSKMIELVMRGIIQIEKEEWDTWELWYNQK